MTYTACKRVIERGLERGTLNKDDMMNKLDIFLLGGRITEEQYAELAEMVSG